MARFRIDGVYEVAIRASYERQAAGERGRTLDPGKLFVILAEGNGMAHAPEQAPGLRREAVLMRVARSECNDPIRHSR